MYDPMNSAVDVESVGSAFSFDVGRSDPEDNELLSEFDEGGRSPCAMYRPMGTLEVLSFVPRESDWDPGRKRFCLEELELTETIPHEYKH